jgi:hypothetical protein
MGANSTQGMATLLFLLAFTFLGMSFFYDGNLLWMVLFVATLAGSVVMFRKCKPWEHVHR